MKKTPRLLIISSYITLYIVWGSIYFFIKMAVQTIPPFYVVGLRHTLGGGAILLIAYLSGRIKVWPTWKEVLASFFLGTFLLLIGNGLVTVAGKTVDSYMIALTVAASPIAVAFYDRVLLKQHVSAIRFLGIIVGVVGVALLLYDGRSLASSLSPGILIVIGGVAAWSFATSMGHRVKTYRDPLVSSGIQMLFVGLVSLIGVSFFPPTPAEFLPQVSGSSILGLSVLIVLGSLSFVAFNYLIVHEPATRVVSYALVNPVIATVLGLLVGNESPMPYLFIGLPLILIGVTLMLYGETIIPYLKKRLTKPALDCRE